MNSNVDASYLLMYDGTATSISIFPEYLVALIFFNAISNASLHCCLSQKSVIYTLL